MDENSLVQKCKRQLLWITAPEAMMRIRDTVLWSTRSICVNKLEKEYFELPIHNGLIQLLDFFNSQNCSKKNNPAELNSDASLVLVLTHDHELESLHKQFHNFRIEWIRHFKSEKQFYKKIHQFFDSGSNQLLLICRGAEDFGHILLAKSIIEICKRNAKNSLEPKHVCIICHLDRQKDGPITQINFLSDWKLVMLDRLRESNKPLPYMIGSTLKEVLESRNPLRETIRNNIFLAFTTIQYIGTGHTAEKMMQVVCNVKKTDQCLSVLEALVFAYIKRISATEFENWKRTVAYNEDALVKSSSYMNALEQYLSDQIKNPLCKIIFKIEEANAFDCVFLKDDCREKRFLLWKNMAMKESYVNVSNIKDPCGPEFYTCNSERLCLKYPFSFIVINKVEQIKENFLKKLRHIRLANGLSECDELDTSVLIKLVEQYNDNVKEHLFEYIEVDYPDKFSEYQNDFYLMMSSQEIEILNEEERVETMKRAQAMFDAEKYFHDFAMQVTNLHLLQWVYSSVFDSFIKVMSVVKNHIDISVVSFLSEEIEEPVSTDEVEDCKNERYILVEKLTKIFLPTSNFMIKFSSAQQWQYVVSTVLPFLAGISFDSPSLHVLRFCNDVAEALISLDQEVAVGILSTFGDSLMNHRGLETSEMFQFVMRQVNRLRDDKNVDIENIQLFLCQYLLRSFAINAEKNATLKSFLVTISQKPILDRNLQFFGPILDFVLEIENNERDLRNVIFMNLETLDEDGYLHHINRCICECPDSILSSLLVASLQKVYLGKLTTEEIESVEGSSNEICELAIKANAALRKHEECSLNLVASIAYLQALILAFVASLEKNEMCAASLTIITKRINALMEKSANETSVEAQRNHCLLVYFLKCLSLIKEGFKLKETLLDLENSMPVLKSINEKDAFMTQSVTYDPLFMYRTVDDECLENALLSMDKLDEKKLKEIVDHASTNRPKMFLIVGVIASIFYLKSQQKESNDTKRRISDCIDKIMHTTLSKKMIESRVVKMLLKRIPFAHPILQINSGSRSPDIQIVSVLIHLLCVVIFKGEAGNCWYDILTDLEKIKSIYLPGNVREEGQQTCVDHEEFYNHCKIRFISSKSKCPKCHKKVDYNKSCKKEKEMRTKGYEKPSEKVLISSEILQPFAFILLQFFIQGCIMLSYAIKVVDAHQLQSLLCIEDEPEDLLSDVLQKKWNNPKYLLQVDNEDLCAFIHIVIHDMETAFTRKNTPYHCSTVKDCEQVENNFQLVLQSRILEKYKCIQNARFSFYKRLGMGQHSLECEIKEVCMPELCVTEETYKKDINLLKLFRMTRPESKDGLIAQVFQGNNQNKFPLLSLVLKNEDILKLPKFILPILQWHRSTVSIGSYKMKKVDCKNETIEQLFKMINDEKEKELFVKHFEKFKKNWNYLLERPTTVFQSLLKQENPLSRKTNIIDCIIIDENSIIHKVLMKLVDIHNYFIDSCLQFATASSIQSLYFLKTRENLSQVKSTSLWELAEQDTMKFSSLDGNILQYSQCKLEFGEGQDRYYNLQKIENELAHDLVLGKPYIYVPSTFPHISFLDELFQNTFQL